MEVDLELTRRICSLAKHHNITPEAYLSAVIGEKYHTMTAEKFSDFLTAEKESLFRRNHDDYRRGYEDALLKIRKFMEVNYCV